MIAFCSTAASSLVPQISIQCKRLALECSWPSHLCWLSSDSMLRIELKCFFWTYSLIQTLMLFFSLLFPLQQTLLCSAVEEVSVLSYYIFIVTSFWDVRWFLHDFDSGKHIAVHWHMKSEVSNHVCGCPCGRLMEQHYPGPHLETFLHTFWHDWSNYT